MKTETWLTNLVIEADRLRDFLSFWFEKPIQIEVEELGAKESAWIWGKLPIGQRKKWFKFAIYLLMGKAVFLFVEGGSCWPSKANDQFLHGVIFGKIGYEGERIFYGDIETKDLDLFSRGFECWAWLNGDDLGDWREISMAELISRYQKLWLSACLVEGEVV